MAGDTVNVSWIDQTARSRTNNYIIPNSNQCKGCHKAGETMLPIGPKARHLNRDFAYAAGTENQLAALEPHWRLKARLIPASSSAGGLGRPQNRHARRPAGPGSKSTAPIATTLKDQRRTRASTSWPRSKTQRRLESLSRRSPPASAPADSPTTLFRASRSIDTRFPHRLDPSRCDDARAGKTAGPQRGCALIREWIAAMARSQRLTAC